MEDKRLIKSFVWHGEQCFFVSTIKRDSSADVPPPAPRYAETIAWEYDWETQERGKQVAMEGEGPPFPQHYDVCGKLFRYGKVFDTED